MGSVGVAFYEGSFSLLEAYIVPFGNETAMMDVIVYATDEECEPSVSISLAGCANPIYPGSGWIPSPLSCAFCPIAGARPGPDKGGFEQPDRGPDTPR
ncbi:unnamed protein product [Vitrella brassicaformis CCMP3155]|uniref:Uncharacterized protein n=1 Tax=Vitrella brassicaformis (strain CCMP3155) TaxID=1169540 RepID=A0A0G4EDB7_VITBC|nr:unnamed protein product [Vitrella brassicaformis CCMP3155]|eukprot:CEL93684.1 unnamed protein product [Vitrella brassicaformis CCMP3155]